MFQAGFRDSPETTSRHVGPRPAGRLALLTCVLALAVPGCSGGDVDARRVIAEFDAIASPRLWPGFRPADVPLAIYDGGRTVLLRHPRPPEEFRRLARWPEAWSFDGRHPAVVANGTAEIGGLPTATLLGGSGSSEGADARRLAGILVHEAFHIFQDERHPGWTANEVDLFTYPVEDVELLRLRRLETAALRRAVEAPDSLREACWAAEAVRLRDQRFRRLGTSGAAYERGTELREGLASYVEAAATGAGPPRLPAAGYAPEAVRERGYDSGRALAWLLDRHAGDWKRGLELPPSGEAAPEGGDSEARNADPEARSLDALLASALGAPPPATARRRRPCRLPPDELRRTLAVARADLDSLAAERRRTLRTFESRPGWRVRFAAASAPLSPAGFDPMNVRTLGPSTLLHTRYLKLAGPAASLEVVDAEVLTRGAGGHPLFPAIEEALLTGLPERPAVERAGDTVQVRAAGLMAEVTGARLEWVDRELLVTLGPVEEEG